MQIHIEMRAPEMGAVIRDVGHFVCVEEEKGPIEKLVLVIDLSTSKCRLERMHKYLKLRTQLNVFFFIKYIYTLRTNLKIQIKCAKVAKNFRPQKRKDFYTKHVHPAPSTHRIPHRAL